MSMNPIWQKETEGFPQTWTAPLLMVWLTELSAGIDERSLQE